MLSHKTASNTHCSYLLKIIAFEYQNPPVLAHSNLRLNCEERLWHKSSTGKSNLFQLRNQHFLMEIKNMLITKNIKLF